MFFPKTKEQKASEARVKAVVGIAKDLLKQKLSSTELMYFEDGKIGPLVQAIKVRMRSEGRPPEPLVENFIAFQTVYLKLSREEQEKFRKTMSDFFKQLYQVHAKFQINRMYHNPKELKELKAMFAYGVNSKGQAESKLMSNKVEKYQQFTNYLLSGAGRVTYKDRGARLYLISISSRLYNLKQRRPGGSKTELNSTRSFDVNDDVSTLISVIHRLKEISSPECKDKNKDEARYLSDLISVGLKPWFYRQLYNHMKEVKGAHSVRQIEEWFEQIKSEVQQVIALNGEDDLKEAKRCLSDFGSRLKQLKEIDSLDQRYKHKESAGLLKGLFKTIERVAMPGMVDVPEASFGHGFTAPSGVLADFENMAKTIGLDVSMFSLDAELGRMDRFIAYYKNPIFTNPIQQGTNLQVLVNLVKAGKMLKEIPTDLSKFKKDEGVVREKIEELRMVVVPLANNAEKLIKKQTGESVDKLSPEQLKGALELAKEGAESKEKKANVRFSEETTGVETTLSNQGLGKRLKHERQKNQDQVDRGLETLGDLKLSDAQRKKAKDFIELDTNKMIKDYEERQGSISSGFESNGGWRIVRRIAQILEHNEHSNNKIAVKPPKAASSNLKACFNEAVKLQGLSKMATWIGELNKYFDGVEEGGEYDQSFDASDVKEIEIFVSELKTESLTGQSESANLTRKIIAPAIKLLQHYQKKCYSVEKPLEALKDIHVMLEKSKPRQKAISFGGEDRSPDTSPNTSIESGPTDSDCRSDEEDLDGSQRPGF